MLACHVPAQLVSSGQPDVLVDGEYDEPVHVALTDGVVSQAGTRELKFLKVKSRNAVTGGCHWY